MKSSKMKARDGGQLAFEVRGRVKDVPPVALIHSLGLKHASWDAVTPALAETTAMLTPVAMSEKLHRGVAGSTMTVIKNARHLTPPECPQRIVSELQKLEAVPAK